MSKIIIVDLGDDRVRIAEATVTVGRRGSVRLQRVESRTIEQSAAATLAEWAKQSKWTGAGAIAAVGRSEVEVRTIELPPVPAEELPDMLRFQATKHFTQAGERSAIDFLTLAPADPTGDASDESSAGVQTRRMLAAAVESKTVTSIRQTLQAAGLEPMRLSMRSTAIAAVYLHDPDQPPDATIVSRVDDELDLAVIRGGELVAVRTVRLARQIDDAAAAQIIDGEVRRSRMAAGCRGADTCRIVLWGGDESQSLADLIDRGRGLVHRKDPVAAIDADFPAAEIDAADRGFANVAAGLLVEHVIDAIDEKKESAADIERRRVLNFFRVRRRPEIKSNPARRALLIGAPVVAAAGLAIAGWLMLRSMDAKNLALQSSVDDSQSEIETTEKMRSDLARVEQFLDADVVWLDEIHRVARQAPPSDRWVLLSMRGATDDGGRLTLGGRAVEPDVIDEITRSLADEHHAVTGGGATQRDTADAYRWSFIRDIEIDTAQLRSERLYPEPDDATNEVTP